MSTLSIRNLELKGKRILMRVDFNVPLAPGGKQITSDKRIKASLPSIRYALEHGAGLVLASHLGRPKGKPNPEMSLKPVAERLAELLGRPVAMAPDCVGPAVEAMLPKLGDVLLLENLRFHAEEEANDPEFSRSLAALCDVYVNDAFGSAHRAHASTVGVIAFVKQAAAGLLMEKELEYLTKATKNPARPCIAILGGAKVSDKIKVIQNLIKVVDRTLAEIEKMAILQTLQRTNWNKQEAAQILGLYRPTLYSKMKKHDIRDAGKAARTPPSSSSGAANQVANRVPDGMMGLDIGPRTIEAYSTVISSARTIIWNGPMGVFEMPPFDRGTVALARAVADSGAVSVVGGGDSEKAIKSAGVADKISHVSTGGGASLEFLAGLELPGVAALSRA